MVDKTDTISKLTLITDSALHSAIVGSLKRCFSRGPVVRAFLRKHRREEAWFKKDGSKANKVHVFYRCAKCGEEFNSTGIQVDHIEPVIPLNIPSKHLSYNTLLERLFCDESNLQILCKKHHKEKSQQENTVRKEWLTKTKYIVYETINKVNNKKYIGVHKCEDYEDFYLGTGNLIKAAVKKYGKKNFYRHILFVYDNPNEAYAKENELVSQEALNTGEYYNLVVGGMGNLTNTVNSEQLKKRVICHQTGEIFESITAAAKSLNISVSSVSKALDDANQPVKNLHIFSLITYDPQVHVSFPNPGRAVVHLNSGKTYNSIRNASDELKLNYKSLRNALIDKGADNLYSLDSQFFVFADEYVPNYNYIHKKKMIQCCELNMFFNTCIEAAKFLKHKNPAHGGIAIGKAIRNGTKAYKYQWKLVYIDISINPLNRR